MASLVPKCHYSISCYSNAITISLCGSVVITVPLGSPLLPWCHKSFSWWLHRSPSVTTVSYAGSSGALVSSQYLVVAPVVPWSQTIYLGASTGPLLPVQYVVVTHVIP